jgi:hypothetical protein
MVTRIFSHFRGLVVDSWIVDLILGQGVEYFLGWQEFSIELDIFLFPTNFATWLVCRGGGNPRELYFMV